MDYSVYQAIRVFLDEMFEGTELEDFPTESYVRLQVTLSTCLLDGDYEFIEDEEEEDVKPKLTVVPKNKEEG